MSILVFSDMHYPFAHRDHLKFLKKVKQTYRPNAVVCLGDCTDFHAISFHDTDGDLFSPSTELVLARKDLKKLAAVFPRLTLLESNHGSLIYRRAKKYQIPLEVIKPLQEILEVPKTWKWYNDLVLKSGKEDIYFHHGRTSAPGKLSQHLGMSACQGHYHEKFQITYWSGPRKLMFDMHVGCLVDFDALSFAYAKNNLKQPVLGCSIIDSGVATLIPMITKNKRWIGKLLL